MGMCRLTGCGFQAGLDSKTGFTIYYSRLPITTLRAVVSQAGRYASMGKKPLRVTVCFFIEHARPRDDYEYPTTGRQRKLQQNNRVNKQNNNFARASRFYFCISLPFLPDYDVKMPNFAFYG